MGDSFVVKVSDLKPYSEVKVNIKCDFCGNEYWTTYATYLSTLKDGKNACKHCNNVHVKATNLKKYGVESAFKLESVKNKIKDTVYRKYGVENVSQSYEIQKKIAKNNLLKYGVTNTSKLDSTKEKVKESNRKKYGVDYPMKLDEFKNRVKETDVKKYGVCYHVIAPNVIAKKKETNLKRYGVEYPTQNKEILNKSISTRYMHGNFTCSSQQYKLYEYIGGELNYPFENFVIDVAFPEKQIAVEWDGSGHDMSVRMGHITEQEFKRNENYRNTVLFKNNWKLIRFITKKDIFPDNIIQIFNYCMSYIENGGHKIIVLIDQNKICFKDQHININEIM